MKTFYGVTKQTQVSSEKERHLENIELAGYTILENVLKPEECKRWSDLLDRTYESQEKEFGAEKLAKIQEADLARSPLTTEPAFVELVTQPKVLEIVRALLGEYFILHLQNGVINRPGKEHHQSSWHRDLPYQDWVCTQVLSVSTLFCLDDFTEEMGGTLVLPFSHRLEKMPSSAWIEREQRVASARAGSVIIFNSMLYHRAGKNRSQRIRRGMNHVYTTPILKQQINLTQSTELARLYGPGRGSDASISRLLGFDSDPMPNVRDWRESRSRKLGI